ncbi:MAG: hypothetical protein JXB85_17190 [Anaerolineales bacterium]|nr:hypothetical protein [Anaerolineales bacterium]
MNASMLSSPARSQRWLWILGAVIVLCLCGVLLALSSGLIFYFQPGPLVSAPPTQAPTETSVREEPTMAPLPTEIPTVPEQPFGLVVEAFDPRRGGDYPHLIAFVPDWHGSETPGVLLWEATIPRDQPVVITVGWCTTTETVLDQNLQHMDFDLYVDGYRVFKENLAQIRYSNADNVCEGYYGIIWEWSLQAHEIITILLIEEEINDGWSDYPAGDYGDIYQITILP